MANIKLVLTKVSYHKSVPDALGEARNFVPRASEVNKNEESIIGGKKFTTVIVDRARRTDIEYHVELETPQNKKKEEPKQAPKPEVNVFEPTLSSLTNEEVYTQYEELRAEAQRRELIASPAPHDSTIKVSKARQKKQGK